MGLKVNIEGLRFRAADGRSKIGDQLRFLGQRLSNPAVTKLRAGDNPADLQRILNQRQPLNLEISEVRIDSVAEVSAAVVSQASKIELPEMTDDPRLPFKVMTGIATGGQFAELVKAGYEIRGHNAVGLKAIIANESNAGKGTGYVSLLDGRALAQEINRQHPGRKFRVPTEPELVRLNELVGNRLSGRNLWVWTETETEKGSDYYVLRRRGDDYHYFRPEYRYNGYAVRLVEDK